MSERNPPVGLKHFLYAQLLRCGVVQHEPFASCCRESIIGSCAPRFLWLRLMKVCNASLDWLLTPMLIFRAALVHLLQDVALRKTFPCLSVFGCSCPKCSCIDIGGNVLAPSSLLPGSGSFLFNYILQLFQWSACCLLYLQCALLVSIWFS